MSIQTQTLIQIVSTASIVALLASIAFQFQELTKLASEIRDLLKK